MRAFRTALLLLAASLALPAQTTDEKKQHEMGVVVRSVTIAADKTSATIEILNRSQKTVTAYACAYDQISTNGEHHKGEHMHDYLFTLAGEKAAKEVGLVFPFQQDTRPIRPGEVRSEIISFSSADDVEDMTAHVDVVVYMDRTADSENQEILERFMSDRKEQAEVFAIAASNLETVLQDTLDPHPMATALDRLSKLKHPTSETGTAFLRSFSDNLQPRNFSSPAAERQFLRNLLKDHLIHVEVLSAHGKIEREK